jgi:hypothetical protein
MTYPFPGMDPYLEHPVLWEGLHARLIIEIANQLQPQLDPRYIASVEERVFVEGPQTRVPDVWVQKRENPPPEPRVSETQGDTALIVEIEDLTLREQRIEILDAYNSMKLVAIIELVSPTNKKPGPGRVSYVEKQQEILARDCHLVELDLHRTGDHVLAIPEWRARQEAPYDYLACVSRWPLRNRFELHPVVLRGRLPRVKIPLVEPDNDAVLDVQATLEQVYEAGRYARRIRYEEPCVPPLASADQDWANELLASWRRNRNGS